jgi:crotonobetainyl-CoA:carnitine CoA-transferase CaiB-like acyl-CoA transferase
MTPDLIPMPAAAGEPAFLAGLRVLELGDRMAVGICGSLLAQLGADVILVEPATPSENGKWAARAHAALNKRSIVVDRGSAKGRAELAALAARCDVVLLATDTSQEDLELWQGERPRRQIVCDVTAFGHTGPLAGRGGPDAIVQAYAAVAETMGDPAGPPSLIGAPMIDMEAAVYAASAIIAARRVQRQWGVGQRVEVALYDVAVNALLTFIPLHLVGRTATRNGNRHPTLVPWNAYRATDGWVCICGPTDDQWRRICALLGLEPLTRDPRFATTTARMDRAGDVDALLGEWTGRHTVEECVAALSHATVPGGSIVPLERLHEEPNLAHRHAIQQLQDPVSGRTVRVPACPIRIHGRPPQQQAIPAPDAHRASIVAWLAATPAAGDLVTGDPHLDRRPLAGVRVVEIGMNTVAPLACRQLGALGAEVIKVEPPTGDTNRWNAPLHECGEGYVYALSNADKRGVVLDLRSPAGREALFRLVATADMVIENLKPGSLAKLGVGAEDLVRRFPQLIHCSVNGFGNESAYPGRPALDTVIQGMSGVMSASMIDGVPTKAGISVSDQLGGQFSLLAMLAAQERKESLGVGARFDIAMQDCSAWATQVLWNGGWSSGCRIHSTADGHVALTGTIDDAAQVLGLQDPRDLGGMLARMTRDEAVARLALERTDCAPVLRFAEVMAHEHLRARSLLVERRSPDGITWPLLSSPMRLASTPAQVVAPMARLGFPDPALAAELAPDAATNSPHAEPA